MKGKEQYETEGTDKIFPGAAYLVDRDRPSLYRDLT